jgi:hypothetical protein
MALTRIMDNARPYTHYGPSEDLLCVETDEPLREEALLMDSKYSHFFWGER